ncbi:MAG TPA: hypothetical protein VHB48_13735 [Chitinophagaceae bacterium]|nr:hypothetical protein [Chitinophagaceae bacterium]
MSCEKVKRSHFNFVIVFGVEINVIEFAKIRSIKVNAAPMLLKGSKELIDEKLITTITGYSFSIKFLNQDDLFLFDRIVSNISVHNLSSLTPKARESCSAIPDSI